MHRTGVWPILAHSMLQQGWMRLFLVASLGFMVAACSLSMNPDLPSAEEGGGTPNQSKGGDIFGGVVNHDVPGDIAVDGEPTMTPESGAGAATGNDGANPPCQGLGGAGGHSDNCGDNP